MTNATNLRLSLMLSITVSLAFACSKPATNPGSDGAPAPEQLEKRDVTTEKNDEVETRLFITLVNPKAPDVSTASNEQALAVLNTHCQSCHQSASTDRMDLSTLPSNEQSSEVLKRIELEVSAPGHMPVGSALPADAKNRLASWLKNQISPESDTPFNNAKIEVTKSSAGLPDSKSIEKLGPGRFSIAFGRLPAGSSLALDLKINIDNMEPVAIQIEVAAIPQDGSIFKALNIDLSKIQISPGPVAETDGEAVGESDGSVEASPVDAFLDIHLISRQSTLVADEKVVEILRVGCKSCHNSQNAPRWDLTTVPARQYLSEIALRINLDTQTLGHMPVGGSLPADDLAVLNRWLAEQKIPSEHLAGYSVQAADVQTGAALPIGELANDRTRIALGRHLPGTAISVRLTVTGADGLSTAQVISLTVSESGIENSELSVAERDTSAPEIPNKTISVSNLTATSASFGFNAASDDRPSEHLTYKAYRFPTPGTATFDPAGFDAVDDIESRGLLVGDAVTTETAFKFDAVGFEAEKTYFINVIVEDRSGNKSVYQKLEILTLPLVLCDEVAAVGSVQSWRNDLARRLDDGAISGKKATDEIKRCFKENVPQCVSRTLNVAERDDIAPSGSDGTIATVPQKRPPDEIKDLVAGEGNYWIPDNIEDIAKQKGWTSVRYKSRHAGGFDSDTPNLLMVFVPGDKVDPPVTFDRWLNFPLPIDDDEPAVGLPQHPRPKFGPPKREEYVPGNNFPRTFTMVSQERATDTTPGTVYFQMFRRGQNETFSPGGAVGMGSCVSCHPNGLRAIAPLGYDLRPGEERLSDEDWKAVELINRKMVEGAGYKAASWGEGTTADGSRKPLYRADIGPIMGPAVPANGISRTKEFIMGGTLNGEAIKGCFNRRTTISIDDIFGRAPGMYEPHFKFKLSDTPNINPDKVIAAMSCEGCHVKGQRWPINADTDLDQVRFKILVDQSMPLGAHMNPLDSGNDTNEVVDRLTADERFALTNCLEAEFELEQRKQFEWMTQVQCQH